MGGPHHDCCEGAALSTHLLRVIPTDPSWAPGDEAAERGRRVLAELLPDAKDVTTTRYDTITFIDQGENFEQIRCPVCGRVLETGWWSERMSEAYENGFTDLTVTAPCCGSTVSLNDLDYRYPAGFARFELTAEDWNVTRADMLSAEELGRLGEALGHPVRQVYSWY